MSFPFTLEEHAGKLGDCATIYSFRKKGEERTEIEKFWDRPEVKQAPDHDELKTRLYEDLLETEWWNNPNLRSGAERWFRDESRSNNYSPPYAEALWALIPEKDLEDLPKPPPSLRLYSFQIMRPQRGRGPRDTQIFVFGDGGVKDFDRFDEVGKQNDPQKEWMLRCLKDVRIVMDWVHEHIERQKMLEITDHGYLLEGDMDFTR
jgi:hypothetical protein